MIQGHVTTERTSKKLKLSLIIGWLLLLGGIGIGGAVAAAAYTYGPTFVLVGVGAFVLGFVLLVVTKILIRWNHG